MYDFKQDLTDYEKRVADPSVPSKSGYDFQTDLQNFQNFTPVDPLNGINDDLAIKAYKKQQEEQKKQLSQVADLQLQSGYAPTPESVSSAQMTEGAKKSLAGMQDKILGKAGVITQRFGNRNAIEKFSGGVNYGTDIGVPKGTKVSVPPGKWKVVEAFSGAQEGRSATNRGYGNSILVQNLETGEKMRFSHLQDVGVKPNEIIDGNKIVGTVGLTGNTTGPHLDLEMYDRSGRLIDILNTPYSSYLGLGQGGGSGKGGGNPMMDKITQVGRDVIGAVGNTPILPFIPQITPSSISKQFLYDPETKKIAPQSPVHNWIDIANTTDPKERLRKQVADAIDMSMILSSSPKAVSGKRIGIDQIDDAIDTIRERIGQPNDQIEAINDLSKFAKENLSPKELKIANKNLDSLIDSVIGKFDDPIDIKKAQIARDGLENNIGKKLDLTSTPKPSTGGEIGRIKILSTEPSIKTFYPNGFNNIDDIPDDILFSLRDGKKYIKKNGEILLNEVVPINKIKDTENLSAKAADNEYIKSNNITMPKNDSAILVDSNNNIIDGHHRYLLAKNANDKTIPVLKVPDESSSKIFEQYKKVIPKVNEELQSLKLQNNKFKYETGLDNPKLLKRISEIESSAGIPKRTK